MTVHFFMMFLGLVVFVVIVRDLYLRDYFTANQKLTWALLFCLLTPSIWLYFLRAPRPGSVCPGRPSSRDER